MLVSYQTLFLQASISHSFTHPAVLAISQVYYASHNNIFKHEHSFNMPYFTIMDPLCALHRPYIKQSFIIYTEKYHAFMHNIHAY